MGTRYLFKCTNCNYKVESSGGKDSGFMVTVETHICRFCNEITDVEVELHSEEASDKNLFKCNNCGSKNINKWDTKKKPCPKCGCEMRNDNTLIVEWD